MAALTSRAAPTPDSFGSLRIVGAEPGRLSLAAAWTDSGDWPPYWVERGRIERRVRREGLAALVSLIAFINIHDRRNFSTAQPAVDYRPGQGRDTA